jgi:ABC-2 type transport system permease protein
VSPRRVLAILVKDLVDAGRDGRIATLLILPVLLAVFYNATTEDEDELPETTIVVVDPGRTGLADTLRERASRSVQVTVRSAPDARAARRVVDADDAAFALVAEGPARGEAPARARILLPENASPTAQAVVALVPDAVAAAADRPPGAQVAVERLPVAASDRRPVDLLDQRVILIVVCIVTLLGFVSLLVVPMQTAEEIGTGTYGALRLAATGPEILAAKALSGLLYALVGTLAIVLITGVSPDSPLAFYGAAVALAISMVGFGMLIGMVSGNPTQINTYGAFLVLPVIGLATAVLVVDSGLFATILDVLPFSQGARLLFDGISAEEPFGAGAVAWLVLVGWTVLGFAVLARVAGRREL